MKDFKLKWGSSIYLMEQDILELLKSKEKGYGFRKVYISEKTGIPIDILTVILKRLKNAQEIELIMVWNENTGQPNGSGYCIAGYLQDEF